MVSPLGLVPLGLTTTLTMVGWRLVVVTKDPEVAATTMTGTSVENDTVVTAVGKPCAIAMTAVEVVLKVLLDDPDTKIEGTAMGTLRTAEA